MRHLVLRTKCSACQKGAAHSKAPPHNHLPGGLPAQATLLSPNPGEGRDNALPPICPARDLHDPLHSYKGKGKICTEWAISLICSNTSLVSSVSNQTKQASLPKMSATDCSAQAKGQNKSNQQHVQVGTRQATITSPSSDMYRPGAAAASPQQVQRRANQHVDGMAEANKPGQRLKALAAGRSPQYSRAQQYTCIIGRKRA